MIVRVDISIRVSREKDCRKEMPEDYKAVTDSDRRLPMDNATKGIMLMVLLC